MVIAESLVVRTFAAYVLRPFHIEGGPLVPALALLAFTAMKLDSDPAIVVYALIGIAAVFGFERWYLSHWLAPAAD
ncbi:hypothetical protein IMCC9480_3346 [Oxalobacteraceae bacterium IMCC9480]|nr:hypothetical protein IMCC9480_3346 [Oxalobacteraceae bacterium IMCC9480]